MKFLEKVLDKLNGLYFSREYLCLAKELLSEPLTAHLVINDLCIKDITNQHFFIGYNPLILALPAIDGIELNEHAVIQIFFTIHSIKHNTRTSEKNKVASLLLKYIRRSDTDNSNIHYYEGIHGQHRFLSPFHQVIVSLSNQLYNNKPGNIYLRGNLYKQVQIAYAIPRVISLITIGLNNVFNLFPSDLNGQISEEHYLISLRHGGKACEQVESIKNVVIAEIDASYYKEVYALGKNHMQDLKAKEHFHFSHQTTELFQLPLPEKALRYWELTMQESFIHGIHQLFVFKILLHKKLEVNPFTLSHVHNCYATWRHHQGLPGNYLNV